MLSVTSCFPLSSPSPPTEGLLVLWLKTYHSSCLGCRGRGDRFVSAERHIYSYCKSKKKKKKHLKWCVHVVWYVIFCMCTSRTLLWLLLSLYFTGLIFVMGSLPCVFSSLLAFKSLIKTLSKLVKTSQTCFNNNTQSYVQAALNWANLYNLLQ